MELLKEMKAKVRNKRRLVELSAALINFAPCRKAVARRNQKEMAEIETMENIIAALEA